MKMVKTKRLLVLSFLIMLIFSQPLYAKLTVPGPEQMLDNADLIFSGIVNELSVVESEEEQTAAIRVYEILKGSLKEKIVILKEMKYRDSAWLQRIPAQGSQIFVLLKKDAEGKYNFYADGNHIALIENGKVVEIYKGINEQEGNFVEVYNNYYQKHKPSMVQIVSKYLILKLFIVTTLLIIILLLVKYLRSCFNMN